MAACTSRAAASMFRFRSNCRVMLVDPQAARRGHLGDRRDAAKLPLQRVATEEAMVSGLAPGNDADTDMVGKSTCGSGDTGRIRKATMPASRWRWSAAWWRRPPDK
jgi:hypothetical protein